jgi:hypothetical protein
MGRHRLVVVAAAVAVIGLAIPAASSASDSQLGAAICSWNHALSKASTSAPNLQKTNDFGKFKTKAVAWARLIMTQDATLRRALQKTKGSSGTGNKVRTALLTKILPGIDAGARMVVSGARQHPDTSAAKAMGKGIGQVVVSTIQLLRVPGVYTWLPKGCFTA